MNNALSNCPLVQFATTVLMQDAGLLQKRLEFESLSTTLSFT